MKKMFASSILVALVLAGAGCAGSPAPASPRSESAPVVSTTIDLLSSATGLPVTAEAAAYFYAPSGAVRGYYVRPSAAGDYPGIIMIHEWWGLNDTIKSMARTLASEGYQVLAVDLYHGDVASTSTQAQKLVASLDQAEAVRNLQAAQAFLREHHAPQIASLGWCFGGGQSLQLALASKDLAATVLYYGTPVTDTQKLAHITWPVLGIFGDKDQNIPVDRVSSFDTALSAAKVEHETYVYPGVGHAFANPTGANYAPRETKDAWEKTLAFLKKHVTATGTPYSAPRSSPAWDKAVPRLTAVFKPALKDVQVGRQFPPIIERLVDVTGDGIPEALVHVGDGGASTNFVALARLVNGNPVPVLFSENGLAAPRYFVEGGSVMHGDQVAFLPGNALYAASWERNDEGKLSACSVTGYVWNAQKNVMEKNARLSTDMEEEFCMRQGRLN